MTRTYLTYSRDKGDFKIDLIELSKSGLFGLRLINKGKSIEEFVDRIKEILAYSLTNKLSLDIIIDLPGEKPLIGNVANGLQIEKDSVYILSDKKQFRIKNEIPTLNLFARIDRTKIFVGDLISIADGEVEMEIVELSDCSITCVAQNSFFLTSNRSFNIKGNKLPVHPISNHDQLLLDTIKLIDISNRTKILVSFVTKASQVKYVKDISENFYVISKIENILNEQDLEEIINTSDAIMLGRGDLISTSKMSEVFVFQKSIIDKCKSLNKELIVATGLFGNLKNSNKPSISDIMDFGFLRNLKVDAFLIAGSNAIHHPFETLNLINNYEEM
ncbi:MAG: pyruvate kinase [Bacteroidia bacterium]